MHQIILVYKIIMVYNLVALLRVVGLGTAVASPGAILAQGPLGYLLLPPSQPKQVPQHLFVTAACFACYGCRSTNL